MAELLELINLEQFHGKGTSLFFWFLPLSLRPASIALGRFKYGFVAGRSYVFQFANRLFINAARIGNR